MVSDSTLVLWMVEVQLYLFICGYPIIPAPFMENTIVFLRNFLDILVKKSIDTNVRIYFWILNAISLVYKSILMPAPHYFGYYSF